MSKANSGVITAGLALFSMFFGAGDLIWPLILGGQTGDHTFAAMLGLLLTGVTLPLLGLLAIMLFQGNYRAFFSQIGRIPGAILIFIIQIVLGPIGSLPRLITLSYASLKPYLPALITPVSFSIIASVLVFLFILKKQRLVDILGYVLTPILLLALVSIFVIGFIDAPAPLTSSLTHKEAFVQGLNVGYNTLDLIASFIFATLVVSYFYTNGKPPVTQEERRSVFKKMLKASGLAGFLLAAMYIGLTHISSFYTPLLTPGHAPEDRLTEISFHLLGPYGGLISSIAVVMACLTTAISITAIVSEYIQKDLLKNKGGRFLPIILTLGVSCALANLGFMGIANMLSPILKILCPGLIVLCVLNILHVLYQMRMRKTPVYAAFTLSTLFYLSQAL